MGLVELPECETEDPEEPIQVDTELTACCDLQIQTKTTGEETYMLVDREMTSVGCPSWEVRASQAHHFPRRVTAYLFGLDAGPDNQGMMRRILARVKMIPQIFIWVSFCIFHQCHLIVKYLLKTLENFEWPEKYALPKGYFSMLGTLANTWRSTGNPTKIQNAASSVHDDSVMLKFFKNIPGRALKGRWGSIESIEKIIFLARSYIGAVMEKAFKQKPKAKAKGNSKAKSKPNSKAKARAKDIDDEDNYEEKLRMYRETTVMASNSVVFKLMVSISHIAKIALTKFFAWHMKQVKLHNEKLKAASEKGEKYLGPTPMSKIVTYKADEVADELSAMLHHSARKDPTLFGAVLADISEESAELKESATRLYVLLVTQSACSWKFRVVSLVTSLPMLIKQCF